MPHKLIHTLLGFILLIVLVGPAVAGTQQPASTNSTNTLTQEDIEFAFGSGSNIADFTQLSPKEMAETKGKYWAIYWREIARYLVYSLGRNRWLRFGSSYSRSGGFNTRFSISWGSNRHHNSRIQNPNLREWNSKIREYRIPGDSWRVLDPGHLGIIR